MDLDEELPPPRPEETETPLTSPVVSVVQGYSDEEKRQARENIDAVSIDDVDEVYETKADAKAKANAYGILMRENGTNTLQFYRPSLA